MDRSSILRASTSVELGEHPSYGCSTFFCAKLRQRKVRRFDPAGRRIEAAFSLRRRLPFVNGAAQLESALRTSGRSPAHRASRPSSIRGKCACSVRLPCRICEVRRIARFGVVLLPRKLAPLGTIGARSECLRVVMSENTSESNRGDRYAANKPALGDAASSGGSASSARRSPDATTAMPRPVRPASAMSQKSQMGTRPVRYVPEGAFASGGPVRPVDVAQAPSSGSKRRPLKAVGIGVGVLAALLLVA